MKYFYRTSISIYLKTSIYIVQKSAEKASSQSINQKKKVETQPHNMLLQLTCINY